MVTDDDELAERLQLIRNHGEVVVKNKGVQNLVNMVGFNYRMTEIEAAIGSEQLKKLKGLLEARQTNAAYLTERLRKLPGITPPVVRPYATHGYYGYSIRYDAKVIGVSREVFVNALKAEGVSIGTGYVQPIYLEPLYQQRIAFGKDGFPFTYPGYKGSVSYEKGVCPVTERMHFEELLCGDLCHANLTQNDLNDIANAFEKVVQHIDELKN